MHSRSEAAFSTTFNLLLQYYECNLCSFLLVFSTFDGSSFTYGLTIICICYFQLTVSYEVPQILAPVASVSFLTLILDVTELL